MAAGTSMDIVFTDLNGVYVTLKEKLVVKLNYPGINTSMVVEQLEYDS